MYILEYSDVETSLYYCNSRYYNPEWGRWLNADDVSYLDPSSINGLNLYCYCGNNPIMRVDPNGTAWWNPFSWSGDTWITIGIVVALVATTVLSGGATLALTTAIGGGAWGAFAAGAIVGGISGAIMSGGFNLLQQGLTNGYDNINWASVGKSALIGAATGAVFGGALNTLKYSLTASVEAAKASLQTADDFLSTIPNISRGGTIAANRLAAQLSYNAAQNFLWNTQYNTSMILAASKIVTPGVKFAFNYLLSQL